MSHKLTGFDFLQFETVCSLSGMSKSNQAINSGHTKVLKDGNIGPDFISYYETLLDARGANLDQLNARSDHDGEVDEIVDYLINRYDFDEDSVVNFRVELAILGIDSVEQFEDAFYYETDSCKPDADFAEYVAAELNCLEVPVWLVVDWQSTWDSYLYYDFNKIEVDGQTFYFSNKF